MQNLSVPIVVQYFSILISCVRLCKQIYTVFNILVRFYCSVFFFGYWMLTCYKIKKITLDYFSFILNHIEYKNKIEVVLLHSSF